ncbi:MAG: 23S rRNA (guanosine(2251)-2'-O)-methyltransferase RlmB [Acidobacteriota bacterium]
MDKLFGVNPVVECLRAGRRAVRRLWVSSVDRAAELERRSGVPLPLAFETLPREKLSRMADNPNHQGVLAEVDPYPYADAEDLLEVPGAFLLLLDNLTDPHNVGAILRSAYCAGVTGVTLRKHHSAQITPVVAKASAGAVEHLNVALVPNQSMVLEQAGDRGYFRLALDMEGAPLWSADLPWNRPLALVVGEEGEGVGRLVRSRCDASVRIPMRGRLDSLNASVAAALALFEVARRRS